MYPFSLQDLFNIVRITANRVNSDYFLINTHEEEEEEKRDRERKGKKDAGMRKELNPLAPEFSLKFKHTLYLQCEYYRNQKRYAVGSKRFGLTYKSLAKWKML